MGQVVTVMNMKGGVGKTTVSMHLAGLICRYAIAAKPPRKVLVIDYDPQFNLSQSLLPPRQYFAAENARKTTLSILIDDDTNLDPFKLQMPGSHTPPEISDLAVNTFKASSHSGLLDLMPSTIDLMYVALGQPNAQIGPLEERFSKFIENAKQSYDMIVIDCHPAGSIFTQTSLKNSDHVLIPVVPQRYAVRGVGLMMEFINSKSVGNHGPKAHIIFNQVPRHGILKEEADIRGQKEFSSICLTHTLKKFKAFTEPEGGRGFVWGSGKPYSTSALSNLYAVSQEFMMKIGA